MPNSHSFSHSEPRNVTIGGVECMNITWSDDIIACYTPPGTGELNLVEVVVAGQSSLVDSSIIPYFDYFGTNFVLHYLLYMFYILIVINNNIPYIYNKYNLKQKGGLRGYGKRD
jgi:hypothetical protein